MLMGWGNGEKKGMIDVDELRKRQVKENVGKHREDFIANYFREINVKRRTQTFLYTPKRGIQWVKSQECRKIGKI